MEPSRGSCTGCWVPWLLLQLPWALPAAFSSSYSVGHAMSLLLASLCPWVGRSIPRDEADSHTHKCVPFPGVTPAVGERFPPASGALRPLPAAPVLPGVLPPCRPLWGPTGHNSVSPNSGHPSVAPSPCGAVSGRSTKSQPCPCLAAAPPISLGCSPQEPAHPRGIHIPHLGIINRHVTTPHSGFCSPLGLEAPSGVVGAAEPVQDVCEPRSPQGQWWG